MSVRNARSLRMEPVKAHAVSFSITPRPGGVHGSAVHP